MMITSKYVFKITNNIWIGPSKAVEHLNTKEITAVLNVARDLGPPREIGVEYAHVGLVDGPGNEVSDYCGAVFSLLSLLKRHDGVLVYDHAVGRSLTVVMMYLALITGKRPVTQAFLSRPSWEEMLEIVRKGQTVVLPEPHEAHKEMFCKMPFGLMEVFL